MYGRRDAQRLLVGSGLAPRGFLTCQVEYLRHFVFIHSFVSFLRPLNMEYEKLVAYCRHELKLVAYCDIAQLIKELRMVQADASDTYTTLTNDKRVNAREILSAYMLAWDYIEGLDGPGYGQRFWKRELAGPNALIWPKDQEKWRSMTSFQLNVLIYARILRGVEQILIDLQDYSTIDRQKREKMPTLKIDQEEVGHVAWCTSKD